MTTTFFKRPVSLSRAPKQIGGGFDRIHNGLISGWFTCDSCGVPPTPAPDLFLNNEKIEVERAATPRPDVPGGLGFLVRFEPIKALSTNIRIECPIHSQKQLSLDAPEKAWGISALAAIEFCNWPTVSGWVAMLSGVENHVTLEVDGYEPIPVRTTIRRPDVQAYLGSRGVGGFQIDLGASLGYALPDTTPIRLVVDDQILAESCITDSPLGEDATSCLPKPTENDSDPLNNAAIHALRRRFRDTEVDTTADWRDILDRLGQREYSAETEQWAEYFTHHGQTPQQVAAWLALRATNALGVPALNPLPADLDAAINLDTTIWPERVHNWTEPILGIRDRPTELNHESAPPPLKAPVLSDLKVAVAGLVNHKSGLGQNAQNSLKALELAGIHACPAPFFPAPGGWNPRLGPSEEALRSLEDHTVLLHLPIDKVIPSLATQPALLRTDRLIGYFMWELETVPKQFHRALDLVDEIWTGTEFVANAFRNVTDTPVHVTGHAVDVSNVEEVTRAELGINEDAFVVHFSFDANSTVARKNPNAALDAFHLAFGDDPSAVFVLKIRNFQQVESLARTGDPHARGLLTRVSDRPHLRLLTGEWPYARSLGLMAMADCYVSLHRSEGFGYSIAEAAMLSSCVVATHYSGNLEIRMPSAAALIPNDQVAVEPGDYFCWQPGMTWAESTITLASQALIEARGAIKLNADQDRQTSYEAWDTTIATVVDTYASLLGSVKDLRHSSVSVGANSAGGCENHE